MELSIRAKGVVVERTPTSVILQTLPPHEWLEHSEVRFLYYTKKEGEQVKTGDEIATVSITNKPPNWSMAEMRAAILASEFDGVKTMGAPMIVTDTFVRVSEPIVYLHGIDQKQNQQKEQKEFFKWGVVGFLLGMFLDNIFAGAIVTLIIIIAVIALIVDKVFNLF